MLRSALFSFLFLCVWAPFSIFAQTPLRNMPGPQGGNIVFGSVDGADTPPAAMGSILKHLHQQYGERPQVGRVFKVRGTDSDAVFFTLTRHSPTTLKIAGMLLVSNAPGHVEAALLSDEAARFGTSVNPMLQKLFETWQPGGRALLTHATPRSSAATGSSGSHSDGSASVADPVLPLHLYRLQDNSASVMLADGWRVSPQSGGGTILAQGPQGETIALGFPYLAYNSNDPRTMQMRQFAVSPSGRNTIYAKALFIPFGADLGRSFMELNSQARRVGSPAVVPMQVEHTQPAQSGYGGRCAILSGSSPASSGQQPLQFEGTFCQGQPDQNGGFMNLADLAFAPAQLASRERGTLRAMMASFQVNHAIVNAQAAALAAPVVEAIHQIGRDVDARIRESDRQMEERRASFNEHNDVMDRTSQGFSNYILDKSVIVDTQNDAHGTFWNGTADALVKSDPKRFEYVDTPNYWKGIDY
jgi:hypothetical protein